MSGKEIVDGRRCLQLAETQPSTFPGHHHLMRDTACGTRELYRMRIENLDWETRVIFVPDSKTEEGRRRVPMSNRVFDVLKQRCGEKREGWVFPSKRSESAHLTTMAKRFREARVKAGLPERSCPLLWAA